MYNVLIYFEECNRSTLVNALELFKVSHKINYFFGKISYEKDASIDESYDNLYECSVCFVRCYDLEESLRFNDFLRALRFRYAIL